MARPAPSITIGGAVDSELMALMQGNDNRAFSELYSRYVQFAFETAVRIKLSPEDAEEIAQDTLLYLWQKRHTITTNEGGLRRWIATTSLLHALNFSHHARRKLAGEDLSIPPRPIVVPEQWATIHEQFSTIRESVSRASVLDAVIFQCCLLDGLMYKEVAAMLHISHGTVRNRLAKLRHTIAAELRCLEEPG